MVRYLQVWADMAIPILQSPNVQHEMLCSCRTIWYKVSGVTQATYACTAGIWTLFSIYGIYFPGYCETPTDVWRLRADPCRSYGPHKVFEICTSRVLWAQRCGFVIFLFHVCFWFLLLDYLDARADREGPSHCARVRVNAPNSISFFEFEEIEWEGDRGYRSHELLE